LASWSSMKKIAGSGSASGSISQRHGSADPDPDPDSHQNVMDPQHCFLIIWPLSSSTVPLVPCQSWQLENHVWFGKAPRKFIFSSLIWMRFRLVWMRFRIAWMRFRLLWMRFRLVVRASDCQCRSRNSHGFDPSIPAPGIWGAADEAVLNTVFPLCSVLPSCFLAV
jgi:hypothetical protein